MPYEIDLGKVPDEPSYAQAVGDLLVGQPDLAQLPMGHRPVLTSRQGADQPIHVVSW